MKIAVIGTNGMLSVALTKFFYGQKDVSVETFGLDKPNGYDCNRFHQTNLLKDKIDYSYLVTFDVIIYASGAGVQAALNTDTINSIWAILAEFLAFWTPDSATTAIPGRLSR